MTLRTFFEKLPKSLRKVLLVTLGLAIAVIAIYFINFRSSGLSPDPTDWSSFGSYLSGTLGSGFAFFAFVGLLYTIIIQYDVIQGSNDEKAKLQELLVSQKDFIAKQLLEIERHRFDDIFFKMLSIAENSLSDAIQGRVAGRENLNKMTDNLEEIIIRDLSMSSGYKTRAHILKLIKQQKYDTFFSAYFNTIFQIFKQIQKIDSSLQQQYMDILTASTSQAGMRGILIISKTPSGHKFEEFLKATEFTDNFESGHSLVKILSDVP